MGNFRFLFIILIPFSSYRNSAEAEEGKDGGSFQRQLMIERCVNVLNPHFQTKSKVFVSEILNAAKIIQIESKTTEHEFMLSARKMLWSVQLYRHRR